MWGCSPIRLHYVLVNFKSDLQISFRAVSVEIHFLRVFISTLQKPARRVVWKTLYTMLADAIYRIFLQLLQCSFHCEALLVESITRLLLLYNLACCLHNLADFSFTITSNLCLQYCRFNISYVFASFHWTILPLQRLSRWLSGLEV